MRDYAKEQDVEETETWRKHSLQTWRDLNLIREKLELTLLPIPEILNYSTREIINRVLSEGNKENELDKYTEPTKNSNQSEEDDEIFTVKDAIEEKYNKPVHSVHVATVDRSITGVAYTPIWSFPISSLKDKIREIEKKTRGVFVGLDVSFNDSTEIWMNEDLVEIEKPEPVKNVEKYLRKTIQEYKNNNPEEDFSTTHTPLTEWTGD